MADSRPVLVTGAFGNVGRHTLRALLDEGRSVVASDVRTPATEKAARTFGDRVEVRWADLTDAEVLADLVASVAPKAVLHLAAMIPPSTYVHADLARKVNVGTTAGLVAAVERLEAPCRLVVASSVAVYGSRNPHTMAAPVTAETPTAPRETYGAHKVEGEQLVRASAIDWTILRIGVVVFPDMQLTMDPGLMTLEALLPQDGRLHAVDGRDVGLAFARAVDADCSGRTLLVAGDATTRMTQSELSRSVTAALGLGGALPAGRDGDPADDEGWFNVDWMDTDEAQRLLDFQHHTWQDTLDDLARATGALRWVLRLASPAARLALALRSPYRGVPAGHAQPWEGIRRLWGDAALVDNVPEH